MGRLDDLRLRCDAVLLRADHGRAERPVRPPPRVARVLVRIRSRLRLHGRGPDHLVVVSEPDHRRNHGCVVHHRERLHRRRVAPGKTGPEFRDDRRGLRHGFHSGTAGGRAPRTLRGPGPLHRLGGPDAGELALRLLRPPGIVGARTPPPVRLEAGPSGGLARQPAALSGHHRPGGVAGAAPDRRPRGPEQLVLLHHRKVSVE